MKRLIGNVVFKHDNALLYCDSAYFNTNDNIIEAFANIRMVQGDSLTLLGDHLTYDGNTKMAQVRGDVNLKHRSSVLKTHFLDYDRNKNIGYYYNHGEITDKENILNSSRGFYYSKTYNFFSIDSVTLVNKKYTMYSDTLRYNTKTKVSYFYGPTLIRSGDTSYIYCENGWYNTESEISQYNKNAFLVNGPQKLKGDSLYYDRIQGYGKAFMNVELVDTNEKIVLRGNYGYYSEKPEKGLITDNALLIQIAEKDSTGRRDSLYLHADTIRYEMDSTDTFKIFRAYHHVKLFKSDIQGKCDSVYYSMKDSIIHLYHAPVMWSEESQMTAEIIKIFTKKNQVDHIVLNNTAFMISREDSIRFNQMKGKIITGFVKDNELYKIEITGNGQSVYFAKDDNELIGANKAECSNMVIYRKNKKFDKILFITKPDATLYPVDKVSKEEILLKDFKWLEKYRPRVWTDIFSWIE
ncbi:MAG: organic solvent tolerance protein OstA [Bacteroidia bacterium]|nr:organic solvent tolerance protein OstA [Bacteroidia bacterium]